MTTQMEKDQVDSALQINNQEIYMEFKINDMTWKIEELSQEEIKT